jgi:ribosomal protein S18 acetylase RimI-like enzyme
MAMEVVKMLSDSIKSLILEEQACQKGRFIQNIDMEMYLDKLDANAEIVSDSIGGRCRGFVAFYCNDVYTKKAFITLILVDPRDRGLGLGKALVEFVLSVAKHRGFISCRLEVSRKNQVAYNMYLSQGFHLVEDRGEIYLLEVDL